MIGWLRVLVALSLLPALTTADEKTGRPIVYDVSMASLEHYLEADLLRMTPATVTRHIDGDTFEIQIANPPPGMRATERIRLMGIDAPELGDQLSAEVLDHAKHLIGSGRVYLAFDFRRRDKFDRLLAFVYLPDGALLNAELLKAGLAVVYRSDSLMYFLAQFEALEQEARVRRIGIWQILARSSVVIVGVRNHRRAEHVLLRNDGNATVDISRWQLFDDDGNLLVLPLGVFLAPGDTLAVGSGTGCVETHHSCRRLSAKNIWSNTSDVATLRDSSGAVVDEHSY